MTNARFSTAPTLSGERQELVPRGKLMHPLRVLLSFLGCEIEVVICRAWGVVFHTLLHAFLQQRMENDMEQFMEEASNGALMRVRSLTAPTIPRKCLELVPFGFRCRTNMAYIRQSMPDSGPDFETKVFSSPLYARE